MKTPVAHVLPITLAAALLAGCVPPSGGRSAPGAVWSSATDEASSPATAGPATPSPTPSTTATKPPAATPGASGAATQPPSSPAPEDSPPIAELRLPDGSAVAGKQGSWCYATSCADIVPGPTRLLPTVELPGAAAEVQITLPSPARFVYWRAHYRDAAKERAPRILLAEGGYRYPDPDEVPATAGTPLSELSSADFRGPPSGSWVIEVQLSFAGGLGEASYYWHAVVP